MTAARRTLRLDTPFAMTHGVLHGAEVAYETWGELNDARDNAVLIFTGLSPSAHVCSSPQDPSPGWWESMVGPDRPLDTHRYFVVCINSLGSCFGSTGPASIDPATGERYRLAFPVLTIEDIAECGHQVIRQLGISRLHATIGCSMGGMTALALQLLHPGISAQLVTISSSARSQPYSIAIRSLQREMIRSDPDWRGGNYPVEHPPVSGMRLARKLGMISYRSAREWELRFGRERTADGHCPDDPFCIDFEVEAYLEAHANKFIGTFDANCYLYLSRAMDLFDAADHGGSLSAALARLVLERALVIGVETDFLFPIAQQVELAEGLAAAGIATELQRLDSLQGHDAFLADMDRFRPLIQRFFAADPRPVRAREEPAAVLGGTAGKARSRPH